MIDFDPFDLDTIGQCGADMIADYPWIVVTILVVAVIAAVMTS